MSEGPLLGALDCGQQVPGVLSVCTIIHFLHEVIYLDTRGQRHKRGDSSSVITRLSSAEGRDAGQMCSDSAFPTAARMEATVTGRGDVTLCPTAHPPAVQLCATLGAVTSDSPVTQHRTLRDGAAEKVTGAGNGSSTRPEPSKGLLRDRGYCTGAFLKSKQAK